MYRGSWVSLYCTGGLLCSSTYLHINPKRTKSAQTLGSLFLLSLCISGIFHLPVVQTWVFGPLTKHSGVGGTEGMGEGNWACCVFSPNENVKKACQTWRRRWWRRPESIFGRVHLSQHRGQRDRKTASVQDKFQERLSIWFLPSCPAYSLAGTQRNIQQVKKNVPLLTLCVFNRVGERVRVRHELHSQRGYQRAPGGCGRSQTGGD